MTFFVAMVVEMPWATIYSTLECISSWERFFSFAALTTAFAIECGKCSSGQAAIRRSSSSLFSQKETTFATVGLALVRVPVLSKTMWSLRNRLHVFAALDCNLVGAGLTDCRQHGDRHCKLQGAGEVYHQNGQGLGGISRQQIGQSRSAQRIGNQTSARCSALLSTPDFSFSDSSIIVTILS